MENIQFSFPTTPNKAGQGKLISFFSIRPGAGASVLACLYASFLAERKETALIDLNPDSKARTYLGMPEEVTSASIVNINSVFDANDIYSAAEKTSQNILLFPGVTRIMSQSQVTVQTHLKAATYLKQSFNHSVAILGPLSQNWITAMLSDVICVVLSPNRPDLDGFREHMEFLSRLGCQDRVKIILNQYDIPGAIKKDDIAKHFAVDYVLPYDKTIRVEANRRKPLVKSSHRNIFRAITKELNKETSAAAIDSFLVASLAVRDGLATYDVLPTSKTDYTNNEIMSGDAYRALRWKIQAVVREQFTLEETHPSKARNPVTRSKFNELVIRNLDADIKEPDIPALTTRLFNDILGYGPLEEYFNDPEVTEIKVNGTQIKVEKKGVEIEVKEQFENIEQTVDLIRRMISLTGRRIDAAEPEVNARLHDGSRLIAQISPIAVEGAMITIRRFRQDITATSLIQNRAVSSEIMDFLKAAVAVRSNMVIAGGTSSGKTTWLNVLASFISDNHSVITIEDPAELQLQHPDVRRIEARPPNIEGKGEYTQSDGVKSSLRMAPDIVIVGECRREEAFDMLQAMNTGHLGSMTTIHCNSAHHAVDRLENMVAQAGMNLPHDAILNQIADAIDIIVYVVQDSTGRRRLDHIVEIVGTERAGDGRTVGVIINPLWQYNPDTDSWEWIAHDFKRRDKFALGGWICPN